MLDRTCTTDADCVAVVHETNCCGGMLWIGIRTSALQMFTTLEGQCQASYPGCGCFDNTDSTDDGSRIASPSSAAATCQAGVCKTYAPACGHLCTAGSSCLTCTNLSTGAMTSACSPLCTDDASCTNSSLPRCNRGFSISLCAPANTRCELTN